MKGISQKHNPETRHLSILALSLPFLFSAFVSAQHNLPLNREWTMDFDKACNKPGTTDAINFGRTTDGKFIEWREALPDTCFYPLSCFKPLIVTGSKIKKDTTKSLFFRKIKKESLFVVNDTSDKFLLTIDPLFNFEKGKDLQDTTREDLYKNTRGVLVRGDIGTQFSFETSFLENQATFTKYIDDHIKNGNKYFSNPTNYPYNVIPGQGRSKAFKKTGYDFAMASGYVSYSPGKHFNLQAGTGKHFVGDGYRSLLLSDNAFNYPFARITSTFGKIQYTNLYASFMNLTDGGVPTPPGTERLFQKKSGSFQHLNWNAHKRIQIGLFQGMIWDASDSTNTQHLNAYYFNPLMGVSVMRFGMNGTNNVLLGLTGRMKITSSLVLYGQFMLDDYSKDFFGGGYLRNKHGFQAGIKYFDFLTVKNFHLQVEYNETHPYTYAHKRPEQSYTHYNQPLAHPLGANFSESIAIINYRIGDFFAELKMNYAYIGRDSAGKNYGNTVFNSDNDAVYGINSDQYAWLQGINTVLSYSDFHIGYLINTSTNMNIAIGASLRNEKNEYSSSKSEFFYVAFRTSLYNVYYDF